MYAHSPSKDPRDTFVTTDDVESARMAIDHRHSAGRTRIVCIGDDRSYGASIMRARGSGAALKESGLDALLLAGRIVPEEISVIGHESWEVIANHSQPQRNDALTSAVERFLFRCFERYRPVPQV